MFSTWPSLVSLGVLLLSVGVMLAAALHDIVARTVPNGLVVTLAVLGLAAQILHGRPLTGLVAALIVFVLAAICWRRGWLGGGDVKLLGAAALVIGPHDVISFIIAVALAGAGLALLYLLARSLTSAPASARPTHLLPRAIRVERWRIRRGGPLPYAFAIAAGFLFILL